MLITNHVLAGAGIGVVLDSHPVPAFAAGVASHVVMDSIPHWGVPNEPDVKERFLAVARRDGLVGLGVLAAVVAAAGRRRGSVAAGIAGAVLLDLRHPTTYFFGFTPFPRVVEDFHARIQYGKETPGRMGQEFVVAVGLAAVYALLLRVSRHPGR